MTTATATPDQLLAEINEIEQALKLLAIDLPQGTSIEGGGSLYQELKAKLDDEATRVEAQRVKNELILKLATLKQQHAQAIANEQRAAARQQLAAGLEEVKAAIAKAEVAAIAYERALAEVAAVDARVRRECVLANHSGWSGSMPGQHGVSEYRRFFLRVVQGSGGGAILKIG